MHQRIEGTQGLNSGATGKSNVRAVCLALVALSSAACGGSDTNTGAESIGGAVTAGGSTQGQGGGPKGDTGTGTAASAGGPIGTGGSISGGVGGRSGGSLTPSGGDTASEAGGSPIANDGGAASVSVGGTTSGGATTGSGSGGKAQIGTGTGGKASGGNGTSGAATGGAATGGAATGGAATGGAATGGAATGGAATGGAATGSSPFGVTCQDGPALVVPSGYRLVWADEFNVDGRPDSANWGYESGMVRNNEAQYYQEDNATVKDGCLIIEARKEKRGNADYTSSSLRTMGKQSWQYGRFEMRARFKTETGLWPAWWMLGNSGSWPACGEIDIMEYYGGQVRANVACERNGSAYWDGAGWDVAGFVDKQWQYEFHLWRMDWDDQKIVLYLDDKQVNTTNLADMLNSNGQSPFKQKMYMLVNLALGGNNGGSLSNTQLPSLYEVDYIRVFQKQ